MSNFSVSTSNIQYSFEIKFECNFNFFNFEFDFYIWHLSRSLLIRITFRLLLIFMFIQEWHWQSNWRTSNDITQLLTPVRTRFLHHFPLSERKFLFQAIMHSNTQRSKRSLQKRHYCFLVFSAVLYCSRIYQLNATKENQINDDITLIERNRISAGPLPRGRTMISHPGILSFLIRAWHGRFPSRATARLSIIPSIVPRA